MRAFKGLPMAVMRWRTFYARKGFVSVKEAGGEQYILSAVTHADERNLHSATLFLRRLTDRSLQA